MRYICQTDKATIYVQDLDNMDSLKKIIKRTGATHVVTEVQYGAEITCVFKKRKSAKESLVSAQASLNAEVGTGKVGASGQTTLSKSDASRAGSKNIRCSVSADILIEEDITSIHAAKELLTKVPERLNYKRKRLGISDEDSVRGVATKVVLYPLSHLKRGLKPYFRSKQVILLNVKDLINDFNSIISDAQEMMEEGAAHEFPHIRMEIEKFVELTEETLEIFKAEMRELIIDMRNETDKAEHTKKMEALQNKVAQNQRKFSNLKLDAWLEEKDLECRMLETIMTDINLTTVSAESDVNSAIIVSKDILILKFHLSVEGDNVIEKLEQLRDNAEEEDVENTTTTVEDLIDADTKEDQVCEPVQAPANKFNKLYSITTGQKSKAWFQNEQVIIFLEQWT